jgi:transcriptional regulator with XRE-family HTH domain
MMQGSLPTRLRVLRAERGLTLREAAALTDVRPGTLSELERGVRRPHDVTLSRIAKGYGVPVEELLEEEPALAGKAEAPGEAGPDKHPAEEHEAERRVPSLGELLERAGASTRWLALPDEGWLAASQDLGKAAAGERLIQVAREQFEEILSVLPYLLTGRDFRDEPALTPETVEAWNTMTRSRLRTLGDLERLAEDPEAPTEQKHYAELLTLLYEDVGRHLDERYPAPEDAAAPPPRQESREAHTSP